MSSGSSARLAWGVSILVLALTAVSLVLLVLDRAALDSIGTAQLPWFLNTGGLGVLIASRRPWNPIGWLLLAIGFGNDVYLVAAFAAIRGLLSGVAGSGWPTWGGWIFNWIGGTGTALPTFLILFFLDAGGPRPARGGRSGWESWSQSGSPFCP